jgi:hypothetical protein
MHVHQEAVGNAQQARFGVSTCVWQHVKMWFNY